MSNILSFIGGKPESLEDLVETYREMDREIKRLSLDANLIKAKIIQMMGSDEVVKNINGNIIATYKAYEREDFDKKAFFEMCPDQYPLFLKKSTYKMFKLK